MTVSILHRFHSAIPDGGDTTIVQPSNWNDEHDITGIRTALTADTAYYVAPSGSDTTGNGSVGAPWRNVYHAWIWLATNLDLAGFKVTVHLAAGTYTGGVCTWGDLSSSPDSGQTHIYVPVGGGTIEFVGDVGDPASYVLRSGTPSSETCMALMHTMATQVTYRGMTLQAAADEHNLVYNYGNSYAVLDTCIYDMSASSSGFFFQEEGSRLLFSGNTTLIGAAANLCLLSARGHTNAYFTFQYLQIPDPIVWSLAAILGELGAVIVTHNDHGTTGTATGPRWRISGNSVLQLYTDPIPGSVDGITLIGGQVYIDESVLHDGPRDVLSADMDIYVNPSPVAQRNHDGTINDPFLTLTAAWQHICTRLDLAGRTVTVHLAAATYDGIGAPPSGFSGLALVGGGTVVILGDIAAPENYIIQSTAANGAYAVNMLATGSTRILFSGVELYVANADDGMLAAGGGTRIVLDNCSFNMGAGAYIAVELAEQARADVTGNATLKGASWYAFASVTSRSSLYIYPDAWIVPSPIAFSSTYLAVSVNGYVQTAGAASAPVNVTGSRWALTLTGIIQRFADLLGDVDGTTDATSVIV